MTGSIATKFGNSRQNAVTGHQQSSELMFQLGVNQFGWYMGYPSNPYIKRGTVKFKNNLVSIPQPISLEASKFTCCMILENSQQSIFLPASSRILSSIMS